MQLQGVERRFRHGGCTRSLLRVTNLVNGVNRDIPAAKKESEGSDTMLAVQTIQVVDPSNLTVLTNITSDQYGLPLTNQAHGRNVSKLWNDAVFVQVGKSTVTNSPKHLQS